MAHKTKMSPTPWYSRQRTNLLYHKINYFCNNINWFISSCCLIIIGSLYGKIKSSVVKEYEKTIVKEAKRSERGRLPGVLLPLGRRRRGRARRCRSLQMLTRFGRRRAACTATAERQRQPADAADTPPRHHSPSVVYTHLPAPNSLPIHSTINQCIQNYNFHILVMNDGADKPIQLWHGTRFDANFYFDMTLSLVPTSRLVSYKQRHEG